MRIRAFAAGLLALALAAGTAAAGPQGDVNGDGVVDGADADRVLEAVVGTRSLDAGERARADVDGDGNVTVADAQRIRQLIAAAAPKP